MKKKAAENSPQDATDEVATATEATLVPLESGGFVKYEAASGSTVGVDCWQVFSEKDAPPQSVTENDLAMAQASSVIGSAASSTSAPPRARTNSTNISIEIQRLVEPLLARMSLLEEEVKTLRRSQPPAEAYHASPDLLAELRALKQAGEENESILDSYDHDLLDK